MAEPDALSPDKMRELAARSRRARNVALGLSIALMVVLFYVVTIAKLGPGILRQPL